MEFNTSDAYSIMLNISHNTLNKKVDLSSFKSGKKTFNKSLTNDLQQQLALESKHQIEAAGSDDYAEGVSAFIEKRKPDFKGN